MKKKIILLSTALLTAGMLFTSCKKDKDSEEPTPTPATPVSYAKVKINNITVTDFPMTDGGGSTWDLLTNTSPDLFVKLDSGSVNIFTNDTSAVSEASNINDYPFTVTNPIAITNFATTLSLSVMDKDNPALFDNHDVIGSGTFTINSIKTNYPATATVTLSSGVTVTVGLTWYN